MIEIEVLAAAILGCSWTLISVQLYHLRQTTSHVPRGLELKWLLAHLVLTIGHTVVTVIQFLAPVSPHLA